MSNRCYLHWNGRFGNNLFQFCYAKAFCEVNNLELCFQPWIGVAVFENASASSPPANECEVELHGYFQNQDSLIYTRKQARQWLRFNTEARFIYESVQPEPCVCHRRIGDCVNSNDFPIISEMSYYNQALCLGIDPASITWSTEERPSPGFPPAPFLPDFIRMMKAATLLRGNSTFSWWAATLGTATVYSPIGLRNGVTTEQDCGFVPGNHPRPVDFPHTTDLYLRDE